MHQSTNLDESNDVLMNSLNFELNTMSIFKQEKILKSFKLIVTEKNLYLVLQEPQGQSFKKTVDRKGTLYESKLQTYIKTMRKTFAAFCKNKIIHGNINSKSFLILHNQIKLGYPSYLKTIGVVKTNSMTSLGFSLGQNIDKPADYSYLTPELLSCGIISLKHDIWSIGVVMHQALFSCLHWNIQNCSCPFEKAYFILNHKIYFSEQKPISKEIKNFLLRCLQEDLQKRFSWEKVLSHQILNMDVNKCFSKEKEYVQYQTKRLN